MLFSAAFAPMPETPAHIQLAEELGFASAWVHDLPASHLDVWMTLALAAQRTKRIILAPGTLIPSLRNPMVTASAIATLVGMVGPDRVIIGAGTGFAGRRSMGQEPIKWAEFPSMIEAVQALLRGESIVYEGGLLEMRHGKEAPSRPIDVPWVINVDGPRGIGQAGEMGLGVFISRPQPDCDYAGAERVVLLGYGTVFQDGEDFESPRVIETLGPRVSVRRRSLPQRRGERLAALPNTETAAKLVGGVDAADRFLTMDEGHMMIMEDPGRGTGGFDSSSAALLACTEEQMAARLEQLAAQGITEVAFQPMGNIARELQIFADTVGM